MEMATDEPIPTASQQELSGSNSGHLTVDYDSEDANYFDLKKIYGAMWEGQMGATAKLWGIGATVPCEEA